MASVADVDAVSIACARLGTVEAAWRAPAAAVTVAVVTSTLVKLVIALVAGAGSFKVYVAAALGIMAAVGAAVGILVFLRFSYSAARRPVFGASKESGFERSAALIEMTNQRANSPC